MRLEKEAEAALGSNAFDGAIAAPRRRRTSSDSADRLGRVLMRNIRVQLKPALRIHVALCGPRR